MEKFKEFDEHESDSNSTTIDNLPDDILLDIFATLYFEDLCHCSQVSQRWHRLAQSLCVKQISISKHLKNRKLSLLIDHPFITTHLETFKYLNNSDFRWTYLKKSTFSKLRSRKIKKLILAKCVISSVMVRDLPPTLKHLSLWGCRIDPHQLFWNPTNELDVTCLDLSGVNTFFTSENLDLVLRLKNLRCLYLEDCFRINNGGIELIIDILPQLQVLDLEGTDISNYIVRMIMFYGSELKELYIGHTCIDDDAFSSIVVGSQQNLSTLCVRNTVITQTCIDKLIFSFNSHIRILSRFDCPFYLPTSNLNYFKSCNHYLSHVCPT